MQDTRSTRLSLAIVISRSSGLPCRFDGCLTFAVPDGSTLEELLATAAHRDRAEHARHGRAWSAKDATVGRRRRPTVGRHRGEAHASGPMRGATVNRGS